VSDIPQILSCLPPAVLNSRGQNTTFSFDPIPPTTGTFFNDDYFRPLLGGSKKSSTSTSRLRNQAGPFGVREADEVPGAFDVMDVDDMENEEDEDEDEGVDEEEVERAGGVMNMIGRLMGSWNLWGRSDATTSRPEESENRTHDSDVD